MPSYTARKNDLILITHFSNWERRKKAFGTCLPLPPLFVQLECIGNYYCWEEKGEEKSPFYTAPIHRKYTESPQGQYDKGNCTLFFLPLQAFLCLSSSGEIKRSRLTMCCCLLAAQTHSSSYRAFYSLHLFLFSFSSLLTSFSLLLRKRNNFGT